PASPRSPHSRSSSPCWGRRSRASTSRWSRRPPCSAPPSQPTSRSSTSRPSGRSSSSVRAPSRRCSRWPARACASPTWSPASPRRRRSSWPGWRWPCRAPPRSPRSPASTCTSCGSATPAWPGSCAGSSAPSRKSLALGRLQIVAWLCPRSPRYRQYRGSLRPCHARFSLARSSRNLRNGALAKLGPGHLLRRRLDGADDALVARAAAQVARERDPDLVLAGIGVAVEQGLRRDQHAGRAEPALHAALGEELALERMQLAVVGQALDGDDLASLRLQGEEGG